MVVLIIFGVGLIVLGAIYTWGEYRAMKIEDDMHMARLRYYLKLPPR